MSRQCGFTRASALGPIAGFVEGSGGSISRVFSRADLPLEILGNPDMPLPLPDQFNVLREAAREIGSEFAGAELGRHVRIEKLSAFGRWVGSAATFGGAIDRSNRGLNRFLQTGTNLRIEEREGRIRWSIEFLDRGALGRFQNELLGLSYLIDGARVYLGRHWVPDLIRITGTRPGQARALERIFGAPVSQGHAASAIEFGAELLAATRPGPAGPAASALCQGQRPMPSTTDQVEAIAALTAIEMLEGYPRIDRVAARLGMGRRMLQRRLNAHGVTFSHLRESLLHERASDLLRLTRQPVTQIALTLGYSEHAHFTRAFRRWTGMTPEGFRKTLSQIPSG